MAIMAKSMREHLSVVCLTNWTDVCTNRPNRVSEPDIWTVCLGRYWAAGLGHWAGMPWNPPKPRIRASTCESCTQVCKLAPWKYICVRRQDYRMICTRLCLGNKCVPWIRSKKRQEDGWHALGIFLNRCLNRLSEPTCWTWHLSRHQTKVKLTPRK